MKTLLSGAVITLFALMASGCNSDRRGVSDSAINAEVERQLGNARLAGAIDASTTNGIVTLTGSVPHFAAKVQAEDVAQRVAGVARVQNDLRAVVAGDAPDRPAVNLPPRPPANSNVPPEPEIR